MNNLQQIANEYNKAQSKVDITYEKASYYENELLEYEGVECYIQEINLYLEYVILRVIVEDRDRFEGNHKTVKLTLKEFDEEVTVLEEK